MAARITWTLSDFSHLRLALMLNLEEIQKEIDAANDGEPIAWLPLDEITTHKFDKGVFVLLPLNHRHKMGDGSIMEVKVFAIAIQFDGTDNWRGLNMRVGLSGSPEDETRKLLSRI